MTRPFSTPRTPHPENVPGDFYVEDNCCITCGAPKYYAPEIFAWAKVSDSSSCIVAKQPSTAEEVTHTLNAVHGASVDCIRYRGNDPAIVQRLRDMGHVEQCDLPPVPDF